MHPKRFLKSLVPLMSAFLALALLFAPVAARAMEVPAAAAIVHHQGVSSDHCYDAKGPVQHDKAPQKNCCAAMCMGVAISPLGSAGGDALITVVPVSTAAAFMLGSANELATPPPRLG